MTSSPLRRSSERQNFLMLPFLIVLLIFGVQFTLASRLFPFFREQVASAVRSGSDIEADTRMNPRVFKILTFGNLPAAIDWIWIQVMLDDETSHVPPGTHPKIFYDLILAADLDPAFFEVYKAGAHILSVIRNDGDGAKELLDRAERFRKKELPNVSPAIRDQYWKNEWSIPLLLAYVHLFELNDLPHAADAFREAAEIPGAPSYLESLVQRLERPGGEYEVGVRVLNMMIDGTENARAKEQLLKKRASLLISQFVFEMNGAFNEFLRAQPRYRASYSISKAEMRSYWRAFLKKGRYTERDPWGGRLSMDDRGRIVTTTPYESVFGLDGKS